MVGKGTGPVYHLAYKYVVWGQGGYRHSEEGTERIGERDIGPFVHHVLSIKYMKSPVIMATGSRHPRQHRQPGDIPHRPRPQDILLLFDKHRQEW